VRTREFLAMAVILFFGAGAEAQFGSAEITNIQWLLSGELITGEGGPIPAANDQIGVFFGERLVGQKDLTEQEAADRAYQTLTVYGDDPTTPDEEGPSTNDIITFQYYDESTNTTLTSVQALNRSGEPTNVAYQGDETIPFPLPFPIAPTADFDLRLGGDTGGDNGGGDGGGGGGEQPTGDPDVDGDGRITKLDAAMVLRVVTGSTRTLPEGAVGRADVNGDGTVSTDDAIAVLRAR